MELNEAIDKIFEKRSLLFLGAGFSSSAINLDGEKMPTGSALCSKLDNLTEYDNEGDLEEAAECYIEQFGEYQLVPLLKKTFCVKELSQAQKNISSQHWLRIYTTNYDDVIEKGAALNGISLTPVTLSGNVNDYKDKSSLVIHLNGSVYNLTGKTLNDEFKLTSSSYTEKSILSSEWVSQLRFDIKMAEAIFYIGFSLKSDLDIKRIIAEDENIKNKSFFILAPNESEANIRRASRFGKVEAIGLDAFAELIQKRKTTYVMPTTKIPRYYFCFNQLHLYDTPPTLKDEEAHCLYYQGIVSPGLIQFSIEYPEDFPYYIRRSAMETSVNVIENGRNALLVHGDLGNGKTLFADGLACMLTKKGYTVYAFKKYDVSFEREIEEICKQENGKTVIIVENYYGNKEVIEALSHMLTDQILIVTERTVTNDMGYDWLCAKTKREFYSLDLNKLDENEIEQFIGLFNTYGLWSHLSARNYFDKKEYIQHECRSSIRGVLLALLRSPAILARFQNIISAIKSKKNFYDALVLILATKIFNLDMDLEMLSTALDDSILGNERFKRNCEIREIVNFDYNEIKVKSSVLAEVLLAEVVNAEIIGDVLAKAFLNFDKHRNDLNYKHAMKVLLSFAHLKQLLRRKDSSKYQEIMTRFFEQVRNCAFCINNPHYWLQYAILKLDVGDLPVADTFFHNAYAFAEKRENFDPYQIDNHYARYLLLYITEANNASDFMSIFKQAHSILTEPGHQKETKYYPFKVAQNYGIFYKTYKAQMKKSDKEIFFSCCEEMLELINRFQISMPEYRRRKDVTNCKQMLESMISER